MFAFLDLKTGHLLEASPKAQFYGQLIGSFVSVFVATGNINVRILEYDEISYTK